MRSREVISKIEKDGWYQVRHGASSHVKFRHPTKPGTVVIPHPVADLPIGTLKSISKATGVPLP